MLQSTLEQTHQRAQGIYVLRGSVGRIVEKLRKVIRIEFPTGYQDEAGFHLGVKPAEENLKSCRLGSFAPRRRLALFHPFHNVPLGWQPARPLCSQRNKLFSTGLLRRRDT